VSNLSMGAHVAAAVNCLKTHSKWFECKTIGITEDLALTSEQSGCMDHNTKLAIWCSSS